MNSLIRNIVKFADVLRLCGVRVSVSEVIDAISSLTIVNIFEKLEVKIALSALLAKSSEERRIFSEAFDRYFVSVGEKIATVTSRTSEIEAKKADILEEVAQIQFMDEQIEMSNELMEVYANLSEEEKQKIKDFVEKSSSGKNVKKSFKNVVENIVSSKLNSLKSKKDECVTFVNENIWEVPSEAGIFAFDTVNALREDETLLYKNISGLTDDDAIEAIRLIRILAQKLKKNISRKYKMTNKKARLDLKKTIRSNLSTGEVLFNLKYKSRPKRKDKFLILCDVSASMYRFSGFVLQFIISLSSSVSALESYIFSEETEHINVGRFLNPLDFERKIKESSVWRRGTNINSVLTHILNEKDVKLSSSTVVIMVSDAKTLDTLKVAESLKLVESKCKRILWLNPIPEGDWDKISGVDNFKKYITMLDCSTLEKLGKACMDL